MFAHGHLQVLFQEALLAELPEHRLTVLHQDRGLPFEEALDSWTRPARLSNQPVDQEQHGRRREPPLQRGVRPHHRVLHGVRDQQDQHQVEDRHLPDLSFPHDSEAEEHGEVDDRRTNQDLPDGRA